MSTITIDPTESTKIVLPGLGEISVVDSGFIITPADGVTHEQISTGVVFSRSRGAALPLLSEKIEEVALLAYMSGRPAVDQLRNRLALLLLNHPEARVANSIRPHADVIPFRWVGYRVPEVSEAPRRALDETVGYLFYTRDGQAMKAGIWNDGTVSAGSPFNWPAEAGSL